MKCLRETWYLGTRSYAVIVNECNKFKVVLGLFDTMYAAKLKADAATMGKVLLALG